MACRTASGACASTMKSSTDCTDPARARVADARGSSSGAEMPDTNAPDLRDEDEGLARRDADADPDAYTDPDAGVDTESEDPLRTRTGVVARGVPPSGVVGAERSGAKKGLSSFESRRSRTSAGDA